jgi:hypothetical protein
MSGGRFGGHVAAVAAVLLAVPATAAAATPRQIYADFAAHGRLVGHYSKADLEAALKDAFVEGYGSTAASGLKPAVERQLHAGGVLGGTKTLHSSAASGALPFTGLDLGLIAAGGAGLLLLGHALRTAARRE